MLLWSKFLLLKVPYGFSCLVGPRLQQKQYQKWGLNHPLFVWGEICFQSTERDCGGPPAVRREKLWLLVLGTSFSPRFLTSEFLSQPRIFPPT